jgi:choline dehydrogenase-like flavoprotein
VIIDGRTLASDTELEADVCIVGAGPSGIALSGDLLGSGIRVCVLENGGAREAWRTQFLLGGESVGYPYPRLAISAVSAFGGSSHRWGPYWHARPLDSLDFEAREAIPHSGWPFRRDHFTPYYERAEQYLGLRPFDYAATTRETDASRKLTVRPGQLVTGQLQHGQIAYPREYDRLAAAPDVQVILRAHVAELIADGQTPGRIGGARALIAPDTSVTVKARITVLAAGGIGNARLLLLGNTDHPSGIGNQHDLVGRFFMEHLALRSGVVIPSDPGLLGRRDLFTVTEAGGMPGLPTLAPSEEMLREQGLLNTYFILEPKPRVFAADGVRAASTFVRAIRSQPLTRQFPRRVARAAVGTPAVARALLASRRSEPDVLVVRVQAEQAPNPESRVTLSETRNRFGIRKARLDWRLLPSDGHSIRRAQEILGAELHAAGLGRLEDLFGDEWPPTLIAGLYHHLGTTRMHLDPRHGVVDPSCRVHGVSGLYVTGGSVFPTSGAANPTLTIVALALRLADELKHALAGQPCAGVRRADSPVDWENRHTRHTQFSREGTVDEA